MIKLDTIKKDSFINRNFQLLVSGAILLTLLITAIVLGASLHSTKKLLQASIETNKEANNSDREAIDTLTQSLILLSSHTNQLRGHLGFEPQEYPVTRIEATQEEDGDPNLLFFKGLERIVKNNVYEENVKAFSEFRKDFDKQAGEKGFKIIEIAPLELELQKEGIFYCTIEYKEGKCFLSGRDGIGITIKKAGKEIDTFFIAAEEAVKKYLDQVEKSKVSLEKVINDTKIQAAIKEKGVHFSTIEESPSGYSYSVLHNKEQLFIFGFKREELFFYTPEGEFKDLKPFQDSLLKVILALDFRTLREKKVAKSHQQLSAFFNEEAFQTSLDGAGLKIIQPFHADEYFDYYDLQDKNGVRIGSFAVDNYNGDIYLMDRDEVQICSLESLNFQELALPKKKIEIPANIPEIHDFYDNVDGLTFLLCGSNENNTDTLIIVDVNVERKQVTMFAVPRDLYYKGSRINTIYYRRGMEQLMKELSLITGLKIEKYIEIDMFAFIEVVNILGGVDCTLEENLVDPSYRIKENGKWGYLNYKKGTYHFNGIQALRIARSRHTSSDYERSKRQQMIIISIKEKFKKLSIGNLDKFSELLEALRKYVKTNFNIFEMMQYFNKFKDYTINGQQTLDTGNVLEATYSNLYLLTEKEKKSIVDENFNKGAWILVPKNNDWNLIKWYVRNLVNSK